MKKRFMCAMLTVLMAVQLCAFSGFAEEEEKKVLRVGYMDYDNFIETNEKGEYVGYGVEYLEKITSYAGYELEYVYATWVECLEMLRNREIDLVCTANYTEERAQIYDYCDNEFGHIQGVLYTRLDNTELYYEDFEYFDGMKVGQLAGSVNLELFKEYAERNEFGYTDVLYSDDEELFAALERGEIDAVATESMAYRENVKLLAVFSSEPFYIISYKDNDFLEEIDYGIERASIENVSYQSDLYAKYYSNSTLETDPHFIREEVELIEELLNKRLEETGVRALKIAVTIDREPLSYINDEGELCGIYVDILREISAISGIPFEFVALTPEQSIRDYDYHRDLGIDLVIIKNNETTHAYEQEVGSGIVLTDPFFETNKVVLAQRGITLDENGEYTIAYVRSSSMIDENAAVWFPNAELIDCTDPHDGFRMIEKGQVELMVYDQYLAEAQLLNPRNENLVIIPSMYFGEGMSISPLVLRYGEYSERGMAAYDKLLASDYLISALNKAINSLDSARKDEIVLANTLDIYSREMSLYDTLYKYRYELSSFAVIIVILVASFVMIYLIERRNLAAMQTKNEQLADAVRQAKHASRAKSDFLSNMSHEIRTPMNAVVGLTEIAKNHTEDPQKIKEYLGKIDTSSKVLLGIINNVLDMSAIENDKLKIANDQFNLKTLIDDIETLYIAQCKSRGISLITQFDVQHPIVSGDELRLKQILLNFVSNAFKFTPDGGKIIISAKETSHREDKVYIRFQVCDTGCGMSDEMRRKLFTPFEQESAATARKYGGSGLGLSIAKNLIDMMHGAVSVSTKPGEGTIFTIDIPFDCAEEDETRAQPDDVFDFGGKRLLLCEDNEINMEIAVTLLEMVNFQVDTAPNGAEALTLISNTPVGTYDGILMDIQMPIMNGYEATKAIRASGRADCVEMPIIAMTANAFADDVSAALSAGMTAHIAKPIEPQLLYKVLKKYLD